MYNDAVARQVLSMAMHAHQDSLAPGVAPQGTGSTTAAATRRMKHLAAFWPGNCGTSACRKDGFVARQILFHAIRPSF